MRKEQALKKAYETGKQGDAEAEASSDDDLDPDEDKLAEEEEAGAPSCLAQQKGLAVRHVCPTQFMHRHHHIGKSCRCGR